MKNTLKFIRRAILPSNKKVITSRLVLKEKRDQLNQIVKYKARLVVRGFQQVKGLDYTKTFASTSTPPTWRLLLVLATYYNWEVEQIDFIGAFLNS